MMEEFCSFDEEDQIRKDEVLEEMDKNLVNRTQFELSRTVGPSHQFQISNAHPQVW